MTCTALSALHCIFIQHNYTPFSLFLIILGSQRYLQPRGHCAWDQRPCGITAYYHRDQAVPDTIPPPVPPTIDHSALITRIAELESQLLQLQQVHQTREQENLRLRTRLVDMSQLYDDMDSASIRPRTDSEPLTESTFTRRSHAVFGSLFATNQPIHDEHAYSLTKVKDSFISVLEASTILFLVIVGQHNKLPKQKLNPTLITFPYCLINIFCPSNPRQEDCCGWNYVCEDSRNVYVLG